MPLSCPECTAQMPATAAFCPGCGRSMMTTTTTELRADGKVGVFPENIAGALAYVTFIPALVFLLRDPYRKNAFVRFHSVQCLLLWVAALAAASALKLAAILLFLIPVAGPLAALLLSVVVGLACVVTWLVLVVKAAQGEAFRLPVLGDFAEQHSGSPQT
jgi:uncharacterized membrane protein